MKKTGMFSRRSLLKGGLCAAGLGLAPRPAHALTGDRKFLFFFANGGWDTTTVLDPHFDTEGVDMDPNTVLGEAGKLRFTAGMDRPSVSRFFSRWGNRSAIVNGIDAHSVGHDSARQFMMTGTSASSYSDWPTLLAASSPIEYPMPHVVFSGPSYAGTAASAVVRAGGGALLELLDASILGRSDTPAPTFSQPADEMIDAFVRQRAARFATSRSGGGIARADAWQANLERGMELEGRRFEAGLNELGRDLLDQSIKASELFRLGLSRCAMISVEGGFDTHSNIGTQITMQDPFYAALDLLMEHLATTPGNVAPWLIDETVIVVLSEFGRTPKLNGGGGKDHWPYNSALVVGSGVKGNQMLGYTDGSLVAQPIDFATGQPSASGDMLACENLGTALLKLGGLNPENFLPGVQSLDALLA